MKKQKIKIYIKAYSAKEKIKALNSLKINSFEFVAHRYHCSVQTLYRWRRIFDGTLESLEPKYCAPHTPNENRHTDLEIKHIQDLIKRNPNIGLNELYGKLKQNYNYNRNPSSLYRFLRKKGWFENVKKICKYTPQHYDTPEDIGVKMQLDCKHVPDNCYVGKYRDNHFIQYTIIDEATRQRFIYAYMEQTAENTIDFLKRAFAYFGYVPQIIQTDNGAEFTYIRETKNSKEHMLDSFCNAYGIEHKLIKPRTPRHNGKVERSHRNDNERFYSSLHFYSFEDLQKQMSACLKRSNNIPHSRLCSKDKKQRWLTPMEKRQELMSLVA